MSLRICKGCSEEKVLEESFRRHSGKGWRWVCRSCENRWVRANKPWTAESKRTYQRSVRQNRRGFILTMDAKNRAKTKNLEFSICWRDIQKRIDLGICEATGLSFNLTKAKSWNAPSLDRIDCTKGYTQENVRVVLYAFNMMVGTWGDEIMLRVADAYARKPRSS